MYRRTAALAVVTIVVVLVLSTCVAWSSDLRRYTGQEMAQLAEAIYVGKVVSVTPSWAGGGRSIVTDVAVRVEEPLKRSSTGEVVHLAVPGGTVNGITLDVEGTPDFTVGERVLLYTERTSAGTLDVLGWRQGKWRIEDGRLAGTMWSEQDAILQVQRLLGDQQTGVRRGVVQTTRLSVRAPQPLKATVIPAPSRETPAGTVDLLTDGFEGTFPGTLWSTYNDPHWGQTSYKKHAGAKSIYCCNAGTGKVNPPGPYPANMNGWIFAGPFDLSGASAAHLDFYLWLKSESNYDGIQWGASTDGANFNVIGASGDSQGNWLHVPGDLNEFDFTPYLGQSQVWICFIFVSNGSTQLEGGYVDDVRFYKSAATGKTPVISSISPASASGNTGTSVTIKGKSFGATQGSVKFPYAGSTNDATIVSWTGTTIKCKVPKAESGPVVVRTSGGKQSAGKQFGITFTYSGYKLPSDKLPDPRAYNKNGTPDCANEFARLDTVFTTWTTAIAGTSARSKKLANTTAMPNFSAADSNHIQGWMESSWPFPHGAIAVTTTWASGTTLTDHDMTFNGQDFTWTDSGAAGDMDIQTIANHETGHWWSLGDLYGDADSAKTMYGYGSEGHVDHTLDPADIAGIKWVYPAAGGGGIVAGAKVAALTALPTGRGAQVLFSLSAPASVSVRVTTIAGRPIQTLCVAQEAEAGRNTILWDGLAASGLSVPSGRYLIEVTASGTDGARSRALTSISIAR